MKFAKQTSPHIRRKDSLNRMMLDVLISLLPVVVFAFISYPLAALRNVLISVLTMCLAEFCFVLIKNRIPYDGEKHKFSEHWKKGISAYRLSNFLVPAVSAVIFALIMPAGSNPGAIIYVALVIGSLFGMIIGKLVFGGTGQNIFNPAAIGMVFAKLCFGSFYVNPLSNPILGWDYSGVSVGGTPLTAFDIPNGVAVVDGSGFSLTSLVLGTIPGLMGEVCKVAILIGFVYLVIRHTIDWRITLSYIVSFLVLVLFAGLILHAGDASISLGNFVAYHLLSGGLLFGAVYMATDPVTSPITRPGRVLYGVLLGICTGMIRFFGALPEGVAFSILIGNAVTSLIDARKWASDKYNWKDWVIGGAALLLASIIVIWALCVEVLG